MRVTMKYSHEQFEKQKMNMLTNLNFKDSVEHSTFNAKENDNGRISFIKRTQRTIRLINNIIYTIKCV